MTLEMPIALAVLALLGGGLLLYKKKAKDKAKRTIPPSSNLPAGQLWEGDVAHKAWTAHGGQGHFDKEMSASLTEDGWLNLKNVVENVQKSHTYEANGVQGDWWGEYGFDCKAYALTFKRNALAYFTEGSVRLATCKAGKFYHAVCLVFTNKGVYVLDNRFSKPMPWADLNYTEWAVEGPNGTWNIIGAKRPLRGE